jgi:VWFA-related protein
MKNLSLLTPVLVCLTASLAFSGQASIPGVPTSLVVTVEAKRDGQIPPLEAADVTVQEGKEKDKVLNLVPAGQGNQKTQLLLLIDDSGRSSLDTELQTLKKFVTGLPANTEIAIGYMRNGTNQMVSDFTTDHAAAASKLRVVFGTSGADVSPYDSLSEAIKVWPTGAERREVIMISSGIEGLGGGYTSDNPYVNRGIQDAQKAGVVVYTIYSPSAGHGGHSFWRENWGQNFLSQLSDETGGESYMIGFGSPVSFQPYLEQISEQLRHQFILTFSAKAQKKSELQPIKVRITEKDASINAADRVFVKAGV